MRREPVELLILTFPTGRPVAGDRTRRARWRRHLPDLVFVDREPNGDLRVAEFDDDPDASDAIALPTSAAAPG